MATQTSNLNLTKPAEGEAYSVPIVNDNMQKIDDFAGTLKATTLASGTNFNDLTVPNTGAHVLYNGSNISQMTNVPTEVASQAWPFLVECFRVGAGGSGYYTRQILHVYATSSSPVNIFVRSQSYVGSGTTWLGWEKLASRTDGVYWIDARRNNITQSNAGANYYVMTTPFPSLTGHSRRVLAMYTNNNNVIVLRSSVASDGTVTVYTWNLSNTSQTFDIIGVYAYMPDYSQIVP